MFCIRVSKIEQSSDPAARHELFVTVIDLNQTRVLHPLESFNSNLMTITLNHVDGWSSKCLFSEFLIHDSY